MKSNLKLVSAEPERIDIHAMMLDDSRAKGREHWGRVHSVADRREPLFMPDRIRRTRLDYGDALRARAGRASHRACSLGHTATIAIAERP